MCKWNFSTRNHFGEASFYLLHWGEINNMGIYRLQHCHFYFKGAHCLGVLNLHDVRGTLLSGMSVNNHNGFTGTGNTIPLKALNALAYGTVSVLERVEERALGTLEDAEGLASGGGTAGENDNRHLGAELGNLSSGSASLGGNNDGLGVDVNGGLDGRGGDGLRGGKVAVTAESGVTDGLIKSIEIDGTLGLDTGTGHDGNGGVGERAVGGLTGKHHTVSTVKNSVGNIRALGTSRARVGNHRLKHLGGGNDGLASNVSLADHVLLGEENLLGGDLHTEITTGNHNGVGSSKDLGVVLKTFQVLDLADNLDVTMLLAEDLADLVNIRGLADERSGNEINLVLAAPVLNVVNVLLGKGGKFDDDAGQVHVLALANLSIVVNASLDLTGGFVAGEDGKDKRSIGNEDLLAGVDRLGEGGVGAGELLGIALEGIISGEGQSLSLDKGDGLGTIGEETRADLGSLGIEKDGCGDQMRNNDDDVRML